MAVHGFGGFCRRCAEEVQALRNDPRALQPDPRLVIQVGIPLRYLKAAFWFALAVGLLWISGIGR